MAQVKRTDIEDVIDTFDDIVNFLFTKHETYGDQIYEKYQEGLYALHDIENALDWHTYPNEIPETKYDEDMEVVVSENVLVKDSYGDILIDKIIKCDDGNFAWLTSPNEVKQWRYIYG